VNLRRWLTPGMGVKRWLAVVFLGEMLLALAGALLLRQVYRDVAVEGPLQAVLWLLTLQFLPYGLRGLILGGLGLVLLVVGFLRVVRVLVVPFAPRDEPLGEVIYQRRLLARGPRIVAMGGGTGLSILLRGLKEYTSNLTAVVTVADDGGSSGKLRAEYGIAPTGDIRNCIAALADAEPLMTRLLQYRFPDSDADRGLAGHSFGNLLIAAMSAVEGDFEEGVRQTNRVLAVRGQVVPASAVPLTLHAELADGRRLDGQSAIARTSGVRRVWLTPEEAPAAEEALAAIRGADLIVIGPGSLYTSILPSLLIPAIGAAVHAAAGPVVYVCNVATQEGETAGYDLADHLAALEAHAGAGIAGVVLANNDLSARRAPGDTSEPVRLDWPPEEARDTLLVLQAIVDPENAHHHDPHLLAAALLRIHREHATPAPARRAARTA